MTKYILENIDYTFLKLNSYHMKNFVKLQHMNYNFTNFS